MLGSGRLEMTSPTPTIPTLGAALRVGESQNIKFRFLSLVILAVVLEKISIEETFYLELFDGKFNCMLASL